MFLEIDPSFGWPHTHADWSVTWEAIGAIGTTAAFFAAFVFGAHEIVKSRKLREEELLGHYRGIEFAFSTRAELNKLSTGVFQATNNSGFPFTRVSVLEAVIDREHWYELRREVKMGTVVDTKQCSVERLQPYSLERLCFVYMDRFGQVWLQRYVNFRPDFYNFEEVVQVELQDVEEIPDSPADFYVKFQPIPVKQKLKGKVIHRVKKSKNAGLTH